MALGVPENGEMSGQMISSGWQIVLDAWRQCTMNTGRTNISFAFVILKVRTT
jgi:hypothetical protein